MNILNKPMARVLPDHISDKTDVGSGCLVVSSGTQLLLEEPTRRRFPGGGSEADCASLRTATCDAHVTV